MPTVEDLVNVPVSLRVSGNSIQTQFEAAAPDLDDVDALRQAVHEALLDHPELVDAWQTYSYDKRSSPSPYLDGSEVGFYDQGRENIIRYDDLSAACADFICREAAWVVRGIRL